MISKLVLFGNVLSEQYIERKDVEDKIYKCFSQGIDCNVVAPRHFGKNNLINKLELRLKKDGRRVAIIQLATIKNSSDDPKSWYEGFLSQLVRSLKLDVDVNDWWEEQTQGTLNTRFCRFLKEELFKHEESSVVILVNDIQTTFSFKYSDNFFEAIREIAEDKAGSSDSEQLTFCLIGVATQTQFIKDRNLSPYSIGEEIILRDFDIAKDDNFSSLFRFIDPKNETQGETILKAILRWTNGHPFLTMYFTQLIKDKKITSVKAVHREIAVFLKEVDKKANEEFFRYFTDHIKDIESFLNEQALNGDNDKYKNELLNLYKRIHKRKFLQKLKYDATNQKHVQLELSGLVKSENGELVVRNRIYRTKCNKKWIKKNKAPKSYEPLPKRLIILFSILSLIGLALVGWLLTDKFIFAPRRRVKDLLENCLYNKTIDEQKAYECYRYLTGEEEDPVLGIKIRGHKEDADEALKKFWERKELETVNEWFGELTNPASAYLPEDIIEILLGIRKDPNLQRNLKGSEKSADEGIARYLEHKMREAIEPEEAREYFEQFLGIRPIFDRKLKNFQARAQQAFDEFIARFAEQLLDELRYQTSNEDRALMIYRLLIGEDILPQLDQPIKGFEQRANEAYTEFLNQQERFVFSRDKAGRIIPCPVKVIVQDTHLYPNPSSSPSPLDEKLEFNTTLQVVDEVGDRVKVKSIEPRRSWETLGWIERKALLKNFSPLKNAQSGLEQKFYIKLPVKPREEKSITVRACPSPDLQEDDTQCRELPYLPWYFVFARRNKHFLLGFPDYTDPPELFGWVKEEHGVIWDTGLGLRPGENLAFTKEFPMLDEEKAICTYLSLEDAALKQNCQPILGGERWFQYPYRIPVLKRVWIEDQEYYKVLLALVGTGAITKPKTNIIGINSKLFPEMDSLIYMKQKPVDIFFLIDGTKSMKQAIETMRGIPAEGSPNRIIELILNHEPFKNMRFRFGFRIYRDGYDEENELSDGFPMNSECDEWSSEQQRQNIENFRKAFADVHVSEEQQDDYAENLFGGIDQAVKDLSSCSDHTKILFVIGDAGYSPETQRIEYGRAPIEERFLAEQLHNNRTLPFFIQTSNPCNNLESAEKQKDCNYAYDRFIEQAHILLSLFPFDEPERVKFVMKESTENLNENIIDSIIQFQPKSAEIAKHLEIDVRGGKALSTIVEQLRSSKKPRPFPFFFPGLFWKEAQEGNCKDLGSAGYGCVDRIYEGVFVGYIQVSKEVVEDICLTKPELDAYKKIFWCLSLKKTIPPQMHKLRNDFVQQLENILKESALEEPSSNNSFEHWENEPLHKVFPRLLGLPVRDDSPLLQYSLTHLRDPGFVPDSKIDELLTWVKQKKQHFDIVPKRSRPVTIPRPRSKGERAQMIYEYMFHQVPFYWIPKECMP